VWRLITARPDIHENTDTTNDHRPPTCWRQAHPYSYRVQALHQRRRLGNYWQMFTQP